MFSFMLFNRFLGEIENDNFTVSNNHENTTFGFSLGLLLSPIFYEFSAKSLAQKVLM